jgi:Zn-dependent protease
LATAAERASAAGDDLRALESWRAALDRLPPASRQSRLISEKAAQLSARVDRAPAPEGKQQRAEGPPPGSVWAKWLAPLGVVGLLLWKLKWVLGLVIGKGKLLLGGLTKSSTLFSMLLSLGVYWTAWGWRFALGLVVSLYVHEMGHVAALRRFGIKASAPMFVPGFGAYVRLKQYPTSPLEDARVGLAGPMWGLGAAVAAYGLFGLTGSPFWAAIARVGAWINLFNLVPIWQLDGGRGFRPLSRQQRWLVTAALVLGWMLTSEGLLVLLALGSGLQSFSRTAPEEPNLPALLEYVFLVAILTLISVLSAQVPTPL